MSFGIWVVSTDWMELSLQIGSLANEKSHEITGCTTLGHTNAPRLSRENVSHVFDIELVFL